MANKPTKPGKITKIQQNDAKSEDKLNETFGAN